MIAGPLSVRLVCELLGKTEAGFQTLVVDHGFPTVSIGAESRPVQKVYFTPLLAWLNKRTTGTAWTESQLGAELEGCRQAIAARDAKKAGKCHAVPVQVDARAPVRNGLLTCQDLALRWRIEAPTLMALRKAVRRRCVLWRLRPMRGTRGAKALFRPADVDRAEARAAE